MKEIEVKAKISGFSDVQSRLHNLGCTFSEPLLQKDRIYLPEGIEFPDKTKGTLFLRIRNSNGKHILTLKKQLDTESENIEHEIVIDNPDEADKMARLLGFHEVLHITKKRIKCRHEGITISLDEIDRLGSFIEVEKMTAEDDTAEVREELLGFLETLGVRREEQVLKGYATLIYELDL